MPAPKKTIKKTQPKQKQTKVKVQPIVEMEKPSIKLQQPESSFNIYQKIAFTFVGLAIILVLVVVYFAIGSAKIVITPKEEWVENSFDANIAQEEASDMIQGEFAETIIKETQTFNSTGESVKSGEAIGVITIINNNSVSQPLVATTRFLSPDDMLFRLKSGVTVPAKGKLDAEVYADQEGLEYEIGPTKFTIPGLSESMQKIVWGESSEQMQVPIVEGTSVTKEDIENDQKSMIESLEQKVYDNLSAELNEGQEIVLDSEVIEEEISADPGDTDEEFEITMTLKVVSLIIDTNALKDYAKEMLNQQIAADKIITTIDESEFSYELVNMDLENKTGSVKIYIKGLAKIKLTDELFDISSLLGGSEQNVIEHFNNYNEVESVEVYFSPSWFKRMPRFERRVEMELK